VPSGEVSIIPDTPTVTKILFPYAVAKSELPCGRGFRQCHVSRGSAEGTEHRRKSNTIARPADNLFPAVFVNI